MSVIADLHNLIRYERVLPFEYLILFMVIAINVIITVKWHRLYNNAYFISI